MKKAGVLVAALLILSAVTPAASALEVRRSGRPCWFEVGLRLGAEGAAWCCGIGGPGGTSAGALNVVALDHGALGSGLLRAVRVAGAASALVGPAGAVRESLERWFGSREPGFRAD